MYSDSTERDVQWTVLHERDRGCTVIVLRGMYSGQY